MSSTNQQLYNALISGIVADGNSAFLDTFYKLASDTSAHALLNLMGASSFPLSIFGSPTFSANNGFTGAAASYLTSTFTPNTGGAQKLAQNSAFMGEVTTVGTDGNGPVGTVSSTGATAIAIAPTNGTVASGFVNSATAMSPSSTSALGYWSILRTASNFEAMSKDITVVASDATPSISLADLPIYVVATNGPGIFGLPHGTANNVAYAFWGSAPATVVEVNRLWFRVNDDATALGLSI